MGWTSFSGKRDVIPQLGLGFHYISLGIQSHLLRRYDWTLLAPIHSGVALLTVPEKVRQDPYRDISPSASQLLYKEPGPFGTGRSGFSRTGTIGTPSDIVGTAWMPWVTVRAG